MDRIIRKTNKGIYIGRTRLSVSQFIISAVLIAGAVICFYPLWYTLIVSFSDKSKVAAGYVVLIPSGFNTIAYTKIMADDAFFVAFMVSVERAILGTSINMLLMILTAFPLALASRRFPARKYYLWFLVFNMLFSGGVIPWYLNIRYLGLIDKIWALVLPTALPIFYMFLLMNFFKNVPPSLSESATMDGANPWRILFQIYLPVSLPALATVGLFCFVIHWNSWFDGLILINNPRRQPLQTLIYQLNVRINTRSMTSEEIRELSVISNDTVNAAKVIVAMIPIICVYPFLQKYFVTGLTLGAVKG